MEKVLAFFISSFFISGFFFGGGVTYKPTLNLLESPKKSFRIPQISRFF